MKKQIISITCAVAAFFAFSAAAAPGTEEDPLISQSYLESVVYPYIDSKASSTSMEIVNVKKGRSLYCAAGTEYILRGGSATVIATSKGGVCDVTGGYDVANGIEVIPNHLMLIPVADGRGAFVTSDAIFAVRGSYEIR